MKTEVSSVGTNAAAQRTPGDAEDGESRVSTPRRQDAKAQYGAAATQPAASLNRRDATNAEVCSMGCFSASIASRRLRSIPENLHRARLVSGLAALLLCVLALSPLSMCAATNDLSGLLQKGLFEEEANRNLDAAVQAYQALVTAFDQDRKLAATAVFRLGECYRKLGKTNEALLQYARIVREFGDEATLASLSRQNLSALRITQVSVTPAGTVSEEARQLASQLAGIEMLKDDPEQRARAVLALFPEDGLKTMLVQLQKLRHQEAEWRERGGTNLGSARIVSAIGPTGDQRESGYHVTSPGRPILPEAEEESQEQRLLILQRVEFILGLQKARLQVLQAGAGSTTSPTLSQAARLEQKRLLEEETKLAEQDVAAMKQLVENGRAQRMELTSKERELLALRRQLVALSDDPGPASEAKVGGPASVVVDEEETEIRRLQARIKDSPDLLNAAAGDGGFTPLCRAAGAGWLRVAKFLLDQGAVIDRRSGDPEPPSGPLTPLLFAVRGGHRAMVELLLAHGADANAADNMGRTPLHFAVEKGFLAVTEALVAGKAEVNTRDYQGQTPLDWAKHRDRAAIATVLRQHGAREDLPKPESAKRPEKP